MCDLRAQDSNVSHDHGHDVHAPRAGHEPDVTLHAEWMRQKGLFTVLGMLSFFKHFWVRKVMARSGHISNTTGHGKAGG